MSFSRKGLILTTVLMREVENSYVVPTQSRGGVATAVFEIPVGKWDVLAMKPTDEDNEYWISETKTLTFFKGFTYKIELPLTARITLEREVSRLPLRRVLSASFRKGTTACKSMCGLASEMVLRVFESTLNAFAFIV